MYYSIIQAVVKKMVLCYRIYVLRTSRRIGEKNMNDIIRNIEAAQLKAEVPEFRTGDTVRVHALIKEGNRERIQIFEGTVLKLSLIHI